ncbi:hypothetical protein CBP33_13435 [Acidovorax carolinensis]|nr:hypothetical protein CBP33_13435 [Acidovorax carolinensis]
MPFFLSDQSATRLPPRQPTHRRARGFTLLEVMVVVAIIAVLAAIAAPSFTPLIERWRVRSAAEELRDTMYYARSEAIKRGGNVTLQKLTNTSGGCQNASTTQEWGCGWIVFEDLDNNGAWKSSAPQETKLRDIPLNGSVNVMRYPSGNFIKIDRYGMANGNNTLRFVLSPVPNGVSSPAVTTVCLNAGGRIRILSGEVACI